MRLLSQRHCVRVVDARWGREGVERDERPLPLGREGPELRPELLGRDGPDELLPPELPPPEFPPPLLPELARATSNPTSVGAT
jgi:hypothetical protein